MRPWGVRGRVSIETYRSFDSGPWWIPDQARRGYGSTTTYQRSANAIDSLGNGVPP